jgi:D-alanyl-lipoteichoic acid acyltransferase DltB (MBOAT superfamily)
VFKWNLDNAAKVLAMIWHDMDVKGFWLGFDWDFLTKGVSINDVDLFKMMINTD